MLAGVVIKTLCNSSNSYPFAILTSTLPRLGCALVTVPINTLWLGATGFVVVTPPATVGLSHNLSPSVNEFVLTFSNKPKATTVPCALFAIDAVVIP